MIEELIILLGAFIIVIVIINYEIWVVWKSLKEKLELISYDIYDIWNYLSSNRRKIKRKSVK